MTTRARLEAELEARVSGVDVDEARSSLHQEGVAIVRGVLPDALVRACVREAEASKRAAYYSCSRHNPFLVPDDHPAARANPLVRRATHTRLILSRSPLGSQRDTRAYGPRALFRLYSHISLRILMVSVAYYYS